MKQVVKKSAIVYWLGSIAVALATAVILRMFIFGLYHVPTGSAEPNLLVGDRIWGNKMAYYFGKVKQGWVENYLHQDIGYFFIADIIHLAITDSSYAKKIMEESDVFDFIIPQEGSFVSIENMAIPKNSTKIDLAYEFINFVLSKKQSFENTKTYGLNPSNKQVYPLVAPKFLNNPNFFPDGQVFARLHIIHNDLPVNQFERVWLEVKGA